ncbi:hypothetical protein B9P99_02920 [Candidatus Marsarchaeota G1 archaeon OSP_B]|jgi:thiol-disulfide isomerase/thioredoxin|uniref:Uncharacterized protein n=4 Tax=Candidatus Marsarchaeota group 1 TaxID=2203770 RepID=A0A2R6AFQ9_9ARCH|nr:MAG: hypothetical protein B9Q01_05015 [Candidatus Marsarchaeota G1 archaeon OSP_D]PSN85168.1 MAG: hypothetical protein B9Q02_07345 [Candidatus Marsarchaeota G1 archaeon BE_D]PSN88701.1 MAG: hypothetical protein B9Q00_04540 [Candidatus Marsarchaeota G1 archaeon OSP_C]PSN92995.1 MAG: hypothetical protein B9P99_02920 [Candidatus Marsarchaeota G1 archaeon OSP_B]
MPKLKSIKLVMAYWCPHCVPTTLEAMKKASKELGVPLEIYDIDKPEQEKIADELVKKYGDWSENYLIPQVFFEFEDGSVKHVLTGQSAGVSATKRKIEELFSSEFYNALKNAK